MPATLTRNQKTAACAWVLALLVSNSACNRTDTTMLVTPPARPTAEDFAVAKNAMPLSEVVFKVRGGISKEEVLAEVLRRKVVTHIVSATELELAAYGAGTRLLAALKDPKNVLTEKQELAYGELLSARQIEAPQRRSDAPAQQTSIAETARAKELERQQDNDRYYQQMKRQELVAQSQREREMATARQIERDRESAVARAAARTRR